MFSSDSARVARSVLQCLHKAIRGCPRWLITLGAALGALGAATPDEPSSATDTLVVMTYNLRSASPGAPVPWSERRPLMVECIRMIHPDVIGTQEGWYAQLKDLVADLPEYAWIGQGREGGSKGEFMAVLYRRARLEPVAFDYFWLSDTPEVVGSQTWARKLPPRMVTWVRFTDRRTGREFYFFTTHLDGNRTAQEKSVALLRQRVAALEPSLPVLLTGDFNAVPGRDRTYERLVGDGFFADTWTLARTRRGEGYSTFTGFKALAKNERRIDWILARGAVTVDVAEIVTFSRDGRFPSDHLPVVAWVRLP